MKKERYSVGKNQRGHAKKKRRNYVEKKIPLRRKGETKGADLRDFDTKSLGF